MWIELCQNKLADIEAEYINCINIIKMYEKSNVKQSHAVASIMETIGKNCPEEL